jgi:hypothetical protein
MRCIGAGPAVFWGGGGRCARSGSPGSRGGVPARVSYSSAEGGFDAWRARPHAHGVVFVQWHNVRTVRAARLYSGRKRLPDADALGAAFKSLAGAQCAPAATV